MPELRFAEVRDHIPGTRIDQREHFRPRPGEGAVRDVQVDDLARKRRVDTAVAQIQLRRMHGRFGRRQPGVDARDLADGILGPGPLGPGLPDRCLARHVLGPGRCQGGQGRSHPRLGLLEARDGRPHGRSGLLHPHRRRNLLGTRLLHPELRLRPDEGGVGGAPLGFQARDLRIRHDRIHFPPSDVGRGGVVLSLRPGHAGRRRRGPVPEPIDLLARQGQRGPGALQRELIRPRVDQEEQIPFLHRLVVTDVELHDVPAHLGRDPDEVGANRRIVRLRSRLPLEERHHHGDDRCRNDGASQHAAQDAAGGGIWGSRFVSHRSSDPEERQPEHEGDEDGQARVHQRAWTHIGIDPGADEQSSCDEGH